MEKKSRSFSFDTEGTKLFKSSFLPKTVLSDHTFLTCPLLIIWCDPSLDFSLTMLHPHNFKYRTSLPSLDRNRDQSAKCEKSQPFFFKSGSHFNIYCRKSF